MEITSAAFHGNALIPQKYTCEGKNVSPPLSIRDVPKEAQSLAFEVTDLDAPSGDFVHWLMWNISPTVQDIPEGEIPEAAVEGQNDFGTFSWGGPCPPSGMHRYVFTLYALDAHIHLQQSSRKADLLSHISGLILAEAKLIGLYATVRI